MNQIRSSKIYLKSNLTLDLSINENKNELAVNKNIYSSFLLTSFFIASCFPTVQACHSRK